METIISALIGGVTGIVASVLSFIAAIKSQRKKEQQEQEERIQKLQDSINSRLDDNVNEHRESMNEFTVAVGDIRAGYQQGMAVIEVKLENLTEEVKMHNNFARRMPVVEEQIKVINHRIEDLEKVQ